MEKIMKNNKKICIAIILIIIIAGIIVTASIGFNKQLNYQELQSFDVYIEQEFDREKVKQIANDILGKSNVVETVEIYSDMVTIKAPSITEEQKNEIVNKIKENYEFKQTAENTAITIIPEFTITDMYKHYIMPFAISALIVLAYMLIRYYKIGLLKLLGRTVFIPIVSESVLLSIIAITRIPVGDFTPVLILAMYVITILYVTKAKEKDRENVENEQEENKQ